MRSGGLCLLVAVLASCGGGSSGGPGGAGGAGGFGGLGAGGAGGAVDPNFPVNEPLAAQFTARGLPQDLARYFAAARLESSSPAPNSYSFKYTYPNGATRELSLVVTPNQSYTASQAERDRVAKMAVPIFNFKYAASKNADGIPRITLTYFVPDQILPPELRGGSAAPGGGLRRPLTRVIAQDATTGAGISWTETGSRGADLAIGTALDYGAQRGLPVGWAGNVYTLASALSDIAGAADLSRQHSAWLKELAALEDCAARPTNPVSLSDPEYSPRAVSAVRAARSELTEVTGVRFLNQLTSTATGLTPATAVLGVALAQGFAWNESTLNDYSANTIMEEARRAVVPCGDRGMFMGNVDVLERCQITGPTSSVETRHIVSMVSWVWEESTRQYRPRGTFRYDGSSVFTGSTGKMCTITETGMGSLDNAGGLSVIDDPAAWSVLGYGYLGAGDANARVTRNDGCSGTNSTFDMTYNWLPTVKGIPAPGGLIQGMESEPACIGNSSSGTKTWKWMFALPPR